MREQPRDKLRTKLLGTKGVGQETADLILLYAFGFPTFVVDTYTNRLCGRYPIEAGKGYKAVKIYFESRLPKNVEGYNNYYALIVVNAKEHCRKKPACDGCPLGGECGSVVYEENTDGYYKETDEHIKEENGDAR